ncbi:MAG: hypothetical protein WCG91_03490 [Candidatus Shapirobacteria bacterium]
MKKFNWTEFTKKNIFKKVGWVFLVLAVLALIPYLYSLSILAVVREAQISFWGIFSSYSIYQRIVVILPLVLRIALYVFQIIVSIKLIRSNKYDKRILLYIYGVILLDLVSFILFLPMKRVLYMDLLMAGITWWILIKQDNPLSKFIKNKK